MIETKEFWIHAGKRALYTFAETMIGMITVGQAFTEINWLHIFSVSGVAAIVSLAKSIVIGMPEMSKEEKVE